MSYASCQQPGGKYAGCLVGSVQDCRMPGGKCAEYLMGSVLRPRKSNAILSHFATSEATLKPPNTEPCSVTH